jgi:hypothetical protein
MGRVTEGSQVTTLSTQNANFFDSHHIAASADVIRQNAKLEVEQR